MRLALHNKELQMKIGKAIKDYKTFSDIEITLIPDDNLLGGEHLLILLMNIHYSTFILMIVMKRLVKII